MIDFDTRPVPDAATEERVTLFTMGGIDYTILARPRANLALRYLAMVKAGQSDKAVAEFLIAMIGAEGYDALCGYDGLTNADIESITAAAYQAAMGASETPGGNS
jgi:hypothetical protein